MRLPLYVRRHRKNDDTPYAIGAAAGAFALLILACFALAALGRYALQSGTLAAVITSVLVELVNSDRAENAIGGLTVSPVLTRVAQAKADDMAAKGYFAHTSPEGLDPWHWFAQEGYDFSYAGENLAVDFSDSATVEAAWMASPGHRANILNSRYTEIGIAAAQGFFEGRPTIFVAQAFGTPAPRPVAVRLPATAPQAASPSTRAARPAAALAHELPQAAVGAVPAVMAESAGELAPPPSWLLRTLASPRTALAWAYYTFAVVIFIAFAYLTELEWHRRHLRHAVAACSLLALMAALLVIGDLLIFSRPVLAAPFSVL